MTEKLSIKSGLYDVVRYKDKDYQVISQQTLDPWAPNPRRGLRFLLKGIDTTERIEVAVEAPKGRRSTELASKTEHRFFDCFTIVIDKLPDANGKVNFNVKCYANSERINWNQPQSTERVSFSIPRGFRFDFTRMVIEPGTGKIGMEVSFEPLKPLNPRRRQK